MATTCKHPRTEIQFYNFIEYNRPLFGNILILDAIWPAPAKNEQCQY